jgi:hypothetical protein
MRKLRIHELGKDRDIILNTVLEKAAVYGVDRSCIEGWVSAVAGSPSPRLRRIVLWFRFNEVSCRAISAGRIEFDANRTGSQAAFHVIQCITPSKGIVRHKVNQLTIHRGIQTLHRVDLTIE